MHFCTHTCIVCVRAAGETFDATCNVVTIHSLQRCHLAVIFERGLEKNLGIPSPPIAEEEEEKEKKKKRRAAERNLTTPIR